MHQLTFLGTAASCGVPSYYCGCEACEEALADPSLQRSCSSLLIQGAQNTLIDTAPDIRMQLAQARVQDIDAALFTHEHFDHVGGIPQLEYYVRLRSKTRIPFYASETVADYIKVHFDWMEDCWELRPIHAFEPVELDGVRYTPLPATHAPGTFGFLLESLDGNDSTLPLPSPASAAVPSSSPAAPALSTSVRIAYFPDTGVLCPESLAAIEGVDTLIIDATFNGRNWMPSSHHTVDGALELATRIGAGHVYLTHLSLHYDMPITTAALREHVAAFDTAGTPAEIALDGMNFVF